ncbi:polyketide cyclase [Pandoraea terrae]|uniref:Polyketide cyclase n=1 Tax=Pandoraea terrae TaxID=1537710 RepID=A0A5E4XZP9_9BURK|nr:SRPBCC family protein [Pandoraea terrae]VVE41846.1 polyketide cyclase [Pandoraea terrae]
MTTPNDNPQDTPSQPMVVSRVFPADRDLVFRAWTAAEHLQHWFRPAGYSVPEAEVEFRVGGAFNVCMRSADGKRYWSRGTFVEIVPDARLVIETDVSDADGTSLFRAHTIATFTDEGEGTRLEVTQSYTLSDPGNAWMTKGAFHGWQQTLDRLAQEVARMDAEEPAGRFVTHATFTIERTYEAPQWLVFRAFTEPKAKAKWFAGGDNYTVVSRTMDVRPGGREHLQGRWANGLVSTFDAVYLDVLPDERIVYAYEMQLNERKISASLATVEITPVGNRTRLVVTEQGAFLDGYDDAGSRELGTGFLLDQLGESLKQ